MRKIIFMAMMMMSIHSFAAIEGDAKKAISYNLKDPGSVQFREGVELKNSVGSSSYCGEFNAKNSYGGYVGFKKFSYSSGVLTVVDGSGELSNLIDYAASGCAGAQKEFIVRNPGVTMDSCLLSWQQIDDVVLKGKSKEEAINTAINVMRNKNIPNDQLDILRRQFYLSIDQTINSPGMVESIKKNPDSTKKEFVSQCDDSSRKILLSN